MRPTVSKKDYKEYVKTKSPNTNSLKNIIWAFTIGGLICVIGQSLTALFAFMGFALEKAEIFTSITLIFIGAFLTAINVYDKIGKHAGAGSLVPLTGFANSIVSPAMEFKSEGYILGVGSKMFIIAGPVLVYGITVSVVIGLVFYFIR